MNLPNNTITQLRRIMPGRQVTTVEAYSLAERQAQRLLALGGIDRPAVPEEIVAGLPRIDVRREAGLPVSGSSTWRDGLWRITVSTDDGWTRQRFTLAHEFKHVLDHPFIEDLYGPRDHAEVRDATERICDYFAACLLMPRPLLKRAYCNGNQTIAGLAAEFEVSRAAMQVRLRQTGLIETPARHSPRYFRTAATNRALVA